MNSRYCEVDFYAVRLQSCFGMLQGDGIAFRPCAIGCTARSLSGTNSPVRCAQHWGCIPSASASAGIFSTLRSLSAGLSIFPARYATGYLGDIGVVLAPCPMDFSAWFEVYLGNRWWTFDARHNVRRIGRVLLATGRDATDCAITTSFGRARLTNFQVTTDEVQSVVNDAQLSR